MREDEISCTSEDSNVESSKGRKSENLSEDANRWKRCLRESGSKGAKEVSCDCLALGDHLRFVIMILKVRQCIGVSFSGLILLHRCRWNVGRVGNKTVILASEYTVNKARARQ